MPASAGEIGSNSQGNCTFNQAPTQPIAVDGVTYTLTTGGALHCPGNGTIVAAHAPTPPANPAAPPCPTQDELVTAYPVLTTGAGGKAVAVWTDPYSGASLQQPVQLHIGADQSTLLYLFSQVAHDPGKQSALVSDPNSWTLFWMKAIGLLHHGAGYDTATTCNTTVQWGTASILTGGRIGPVTPAGPVAVPPILADLQQRVVAQWRRGTLKVAPAGDFFVQLPTCVWVDIPPAGAFPPVDAVYAVDVQSPPDAQGHTVWIRYEVEARVDPTSTVIDWGDGTTTALVPGQPGPPDTGPASLEAYCGHNTEASPNTHLYRRVSGDGTPAGGVTVTASERVAVSVRAEYFDGYRTQVVPVSAQTISIVYGRSGPHQVKQVEGVLVY